VSTLDLEIEPVSPVLARWERACATIERMKPALSPELLSAFHELFECLAEMIDANTQRSN
jgi:hypothetical protein